MKARQFKKLCKKAKEILICFGYKERDFSQEEDLLKTRNGISCPVVWGLNTGPDHYGECDWFDAWFILCDLVVNETAAWGDYHGQEDDPNPYDKSVRGTRNTLEFCSKNLLRLGVKPSC